jgi:hypothetical protein
MPYTLGFKWAKTVTNIGEPFFKLKKKKKKISHRLTPLPAKTFKIIYFFIFYFLLLDAFPSPPISPFHLHRQ